MEIEIKLKVDMVMQIDLEMELGDGCELINLTKSAHKRVNAHW